MFLADIISPSIRPLNLGDHPHLCCGFLCYVYALNSSITKKLLELPFPLLKVFPFLVIMHDARKIYLLFIIYYYLFSVH